jgi:hypothetical protein
MTDVELESWRAHWQTAAPPPPDLTDRVERETRMMRRMLLGDIAITLTIGGGTIAWALLSRRFEAMVLAGGVWVFIAIAWIISILLRRGAWAPASLSTAAFLDLSILRCRRRRDVIAAQAVLYALLLAFDLAWIYFLGRERDGRSFLSFLASPGIAWVWVVTAALGVAAARRRRRLTRELHMLIRMRASF